MSNAEMDMMSRDNTVLNLSEIQRQWRDVPYAALSEAEKLDIYLPNGQKGPFPLLVIIHGGGFAFGDKEGMELAAVLEPALKRGYAVSSINYRLSGEAHFPAAIEDVKAAIRYLRAHAAEYDLMADRIALWGSSAGGNLAALAGTTDQMTAFSNPLLGNASISERVTAVVDFFGPINFLTMDDQYTVNGLNGQNHNAADSFESMYLGAPIQTVPWLAQESNPETYINSGMPPFFIEHGTMDLNIPYQQSVIFSQLLVPFIGAEHVNLRLIDGAGHGGPQFETTENTDQVFRFLDRYMRR